MGSYNNTCIDLDSVSQQVDMTSVRLEVDVFGNIDYKCNRDHFVEWEDGACYPLFSPAEVCPPGHQIRWKSGSSIIPECFKADCPSGELVWADDKCYKYQ